MSKSVRPDELLVISTRKRKVCPDELSATIACHPDHTTKGSSDEPAAISTTPSRQGDPAMIDTSPGFRTHAEQVDYTAALGDLPCRDRDARRSWFFASRPPPSASLVVDADQLYALPSVTRAPHSMRLVRSFISAANDICSMRLIQQVAVAPCE